MKAYQERCAVLESYLYFAVALPREITLHDTHEHQGIGLVEYYLNQHIS